MSIKPPPIHSALQSLLIVMGVLSITSNAIADPAMKPATEIFAGSRCGSDAKALEWITDTVRLDTLRSHLAEQAPANEPLPTIDLVTESVFLLSMGTQPTPGYRVSPAPSAPKLDGNTLTISMHWRQPPEGLMLAQVITTPCLLFSVENGDYQQLQIVDQNGQQRLTASRPR